LLEDGHGTYEGDTGLLESISHYNKILHLGNAKKVAKSPQIRAALEASSTTGSRSSPEAPRVNPEQKEKSRQRETFSRRADDRHWRSWGIGGLGALRLCGILDRAKGLCMTCVMGRNTCVHLLLGLGLCYDQTSVPKVSGIHGSIVAENEKRKYDLGPPIISKA